MPAQASSHNKGKNGADRGCGHVLISKYYRDILGPGIYFLAERGLAVDMLFTERRSPDRVEGAYRVLDAQIEGKNVS